MLVSIFPSSVIFDRNSETSRNKDHYMLAIAHWVVNVPRRASDGFTRLYALTLNESHYVRHYRRTYYLPYYRNLKFRSCASHLLRFAAKLCAPQIAVSRAAEPRRTARSIVDLSRGVSRAYQRARGKRASSLHLDSILAPSPCAMRWQSFNDVRWR